MSTDTDIEKDEPDRQNGLFGYVATVDTQAVRLQFNIGYVMHKTYGEPGGASLFFCGEYVGEFRWLGDYSPSSLAAELWLNLDLEGAARPERRGRHTHPNYVPGQLSISDDGEADTWARACISLIMQGPTYVSPSG